MTDLELVAIVIPLGLFVVSCVIILSLFVYSTGRDIKKHFKGVKTKMVKFYEFTDRGDGHKVLINIDRIASIIEEENGLVFVEKYVGDTDSCDVIGMPCAEKYIDVYNDLCEREFI